VTQPAAPEPDDKDWTWTLLRACPECGFDAGAVRGQDVPGIVQEVIARFGRRLADADASTRPQPQVWSPAEYACHIRDVCTVFDQRLHAMLAEHDPLFENWDQDAAAIRGRYSEDDPAAVADQLAAEAAAVSAAYASVVGPQWDRPGRRSNGSTFTIETLALYHLHDAEHHLHDVSG
jgi:hypothetical protein